MPVIIPDTLPAAATLRAEGIQVIPYQTAVHQDIRPLKVAILNIMPTKQVTEQQWLRLLGSTVLQIEVTLVRTASYTSKNVSLEHLQEFYRTFADISDEYFDALIITGAPVERRKFEDVAYWQELQQIMDWSRTHVHSTLHACWGAFAGLYHHYGIPKYVRAEKLSGVFTHTLCAREHPLLLGFDDRFLVPHSRHTEVRYSDLLNVEELEILSASVEAGIHLVSRHDTRQVFLLGHPEYDRLSLHDEYVRDVGEHGITTPLPQHYYHDDDTANRPLLTWRSHSTLFVSNWLRIIYEAVSFDHREIPPLII
jgi:homoserine O-succinyltransferase